MPDVGSDLMPEITNPHDRFFKEVFARKEVAADFLLNYLPVDVLACLDENSINLTKDSFVDNELATHFSDLLYEVDLHDGSGAYVYVLFEHKSFPDSEVAFQLLRYMVRIWEQACRQRQLKKLPPIIPVVLYHGVVNWKISRKFSAMFEHTEALGPFVPDFSYLVCDLSRYNNDDIKGMVLLKVTMLLFKYIMSEELRGQLPEIFKLLKDLSARETGMEYLQTVLVYLSKSTDKINREDIKEALEIAFPSEGGEIMPTIAEEWIQEGFERGMQQGMQQGMLQTARDNVLDILEVRFETVPQSILKRLKEINNPDILKMLLKKAIRSSSMDEFRKIMDIILE